MQPRTASAHIAPPHRPFTSRRPGCARGVRVGASAGCRGGAGRVWVISRRDWGAGMWIALAALLALGQEAPDDALPTRLRHYESDRWERVRSTQDVPTLFRGL